MYFRLGDTPLRGHRLCLLDTPGRCTSDSVTLPYVFIGYTYPTLRLGWRLGGSTTTLPVSFFRKTDTRGLDYNIAPDRGYDVRSRRPPRRGRAAHPSPLLRLQQPLLRLESSTTTSAASTMTRHPPRDEPAQIPRSGKTMLPSAMRHMRPSTRFFESPEGSGATDEDTASGYPMEVQRGPLWG